MVKTLKLQSSLLIFLFKWFFNCFERKSTSLILRREIETTLCQALPSHHLHKLTTLASWSQAFTHSQPPKKLKFAISWSTQPPSNLPLIFLKHVGPPTTPSTSLLYIIVQGINSWRTNNQPWTYNLLERASIWRANPFFTCMLLCKDLILGNINLNSMCVLCSKYPTPKDLTPRLTCTSFSKDYSTYKDPNPNSHVCFFAKRNFLTK